MQAQSRLSFATGDGPVTGDLLRQPRTMIRPTFPGQDSTSELNIRGLSIPSR